jgi:hypothetical protein
MDIAFSYQPKTIFFFWLQKAVHSLFFKKAYEVVFLRMRSRGGKNQPEEVSLRQFVAAS